VGTDSHTINLTWIEPTEVENCNMTDEYAIEWKDSTDGSRNGSGVTNYTYYIIDNLEACVTFEVSLSVLCENGSRSEPTITNATTLPDGK
jgi:hypothetical protein